MKKVYISPSTHIIFVESEDMLAQSNKTHFGTTDENVDGSGRVREERFWDSEFYPNEEANR